MKEAYHSKSINEIFKEFETSKKGLTQEQAEQRLKTYGKNVIKKTKRFQTLKTIFQQFNSFLIYILIFAGAIMLYLDYLLDAIVIFAIVLLNAGIGFFQQYKAEKAIASLKKLIIQKSKVIRDEKRAEIPAAQLVPGDIVFLEQGDKINADCRIIEQENLQTNEAILTGESLPVSKVSKVIAQEVELAKRENMLFAGTQVVRGDCLAVVVSTGMSSVFGNIAGTLQEIETQKTPMQKRLDKFSKQLGLIIIGLVVVVMLLGIFREFDIFEMFLTAVALAIGAIPEGLPAVLAIAFSISSVMMSKKSVVIRRLASVESLGSVTVICSDKTGTITEEKMSIQRIFSNGKFYSKKLKNIFLNNNKIDVNQDKELFQLLKTSVLCNGARYEVVDGKYTVMGDPTEQALVSNALDLGMDKKTLTEQEPSVKKFEFDSKRKMMSILRDNGRQNVLYSKGAPEKIIQISEFELVKGEIKQLSAERKKELLEASKEMEKQALRVLGFAFKNFGKKEKVQEKGLIFLGFAGMLDAPRKEVKDAIARCKSAGIKVKIITGDSALTASAVAKQIGIEGQIVESKELEKMSDDELKKSIDKIAIFARATPHQKLRITKILQEKGEVVAITGDGINDVLALKSADIGIAMGQRGTDIARDVSDVVLIDDNFASIVEGVHQGRKTYDNIKKFVKYMLSVNFSGIFVVGIVSLLGMPLPILPLQILWKNLVTDSFPALTLTLEKGEHVMGTKPRKEKSLLDGIWKFIILGGLLNFCACIAVYFIGRNRGLDINLIRTMVVTTGIMFELLFVYVCRSEKPLAKIGIFSNKWLNIAILTGVLLHLVLLYTPLAIAFKVVPLSLNNWLFILPFAVSGLVLFEVGKWVLWRRESKNI